MLMKIVIVLSLHFGVLGVYLSGIRPYNYYCNATKYNCSEPRATVFHQSDFSDEPEWKKLIATYQIKLFSVVLYRCEQVGCCIDPEERCLPEILPSSSGSYKLNIQEVPIAVNYSYDPSNRKKCKAAIIQHNHINCQCRKPSEEDKFIAKVILPDDEECKRYLKDR